MNNTNLRQLRHTLRRPLALAAHARPPESRRARVPCGRQLAQPLCARVEPMAVLAVRKMSLRLALEHALAALRIEHLILVVPAPEHHARLLEAEHVQLRIRRIGHIADELRSAHARRAHFRLQRPTLGRRASGRRHARLAARIVRTADRTAVLDGHGRRRTGARVVQAAVVRIGKEAGRRADELAGRIGAAEALLVGVVGLRGASVIGAVGSVGGAAAEAVGRLADLRADLAGFGFNY